MTQDGASINPNMWRPPCGKAVSAYVADGIPIGEHAWRAHFGSSRGAISTTFHGGVGHAAILHGAILTTHTTRAPQRNSSRVSSPCTPLRPTMAHRELARAEAGVVNERAYRNISSASATMTLTTIRDDRPVGHLEDLPCSATGIATRAISEPLWGTEYWISFHESPELELGNFARTVSILKPAWPADKLSGMPTPLSGKRMSHRPDLGAGTIEYFSSGRTSAVIRSIRLKSEHHSRQTPLVEEIRKAVVETPSMSS